MLTNKRLLLPKASGDWAKDGPELYRTLQQYFLSLEQPGALAIAKFDYWTPALTFATPGDLSVTYSTRVGDLTKIEQEIFGSFRIATSAFTHTTASGNLQITGLTYQANSDSGFVWDGACTWGGITMAGGRTQCSVAIAAGSSTILVTASGSGAAPANITAADMPTGGSVVLRGTFRFRT